MPVNTRISCIFFLKRKQQACLPVSWQLQLVFEEAFSFLIERTTNSKSTNETTVRGYIQSMATPCASFHMGLFCTALKINKQKSTHNIHFTSRLLIEKTYVTWDAANYILEIRADDQALSCLSYKSKAYVSFCLTDTNWNEP